MTSQARDLFFHDEQVNKGVHITFGNNYGYNILQLYEDNEVIDKEALKKQVIDYYKNKLKEIIKQCQTIVDKDI
jgi:predicted metal-dependent hydrolase